MHWHYPECPGKAAIRTPLWGKRRLAHPSGRSKAYLANIVSIDDVLYAIGGTHHEPTLLASTDAVHFHKRKTPEVPGLRGILALDDERPYAAAILLVSANASGKIEMLSMLHGEIVSVNSQDLHLLLIVVALLYALRYRDAGQFRDLSVAVLTLSLGLAHHLTIVLFWPASAQEVTARLRSLRMRIAVNGTIWVITAKRDRERPGR